MMLATEGALQPRFLSDVLGGLSRPQKTLPSQWLYDEFGSELFERITKLPEYYLTRTEIGILRTEAGAIAEAAGRGARLVEYGAGASVKTRLLLDAMNEPSAYVPVDVSGPFLAATADGLRTDYPALAVRPVVGDFLQPVNLPRLDGSGRWVGFFPGSTIGNLSDHEIRTFLKRVRAALGDEAMFVLGYDLRKSPSILIPAYDDAAGVTAAFNLNILTRINRELGANFDVDGFAHEARWNGALSQIEMHLVAKSDQHVWVVGRPITIAAGESIHTENSRKFDMAAVRETAEAAGWNTLYTRTDKDGLFAVAAMEAI
ncbi:MAG: L-histidine N(alpha)-methyltransferase [Alphaproteobacteria bacterium]